MDDMPRGFPRPRVTKEGYKGLPTPWVADGPDSPGILHLDRSTDSTSLCLCSVCGLGFADSERAHIAATVSCCECHETWQNKAVGCDACGSTRSELDIVYDHGLTHKCCAVMTVSFCPAFKEDGHMLMWSVSLQNARAIMSELSKLDQNNPLRLEDYTDGESVRILAHP